MKDCPAYAFVHRYICEYQPLCETCEETRVDENEKVVIILREIDKVYYLFKPMYESFVYDTSIVDTNDIPTVVLISAIGRELDQLHKMKQSPPDYKMYKPLCITREALRHAFDRLVHELGMPTSMRDFYCTEDGY